MAKRTAQGSILLLGALLLFLWACNESGKKNGGGNFLKEIERTHEVKIAVHPYNIPFEFGLGTSVQGIGADVGDEIAKALKARVTWAKTESFEQVFSLVDKGEVHMAISSISVTEERKSKGFLFSHPYYKDSGQAIVIRVKEKSIKKLADLANKKVGVQEETTGQKFVENQNIPGIKIEKFRTHDDGLLKLSAGEIDAFIGDKPIEDYIIFQSYPGRLQIVGDLLTHEPYAVMTKDPELLKVINDVVDRMEKSGQLAQIIQSRFKDLEIKKHKEHLEAERKERERNTPKTVRFQLSSSKFPMSRLDGFQIHMSGSGGNFTSSHIVSSGRTGSCSISNVPPGSYRASLGILQWSGPVEVAADGAKSMTVNLNF